tara:strand:+ start:329 stop:454 length:126 start_codon:yes stop_codon:yes gene_type:complete
MIKLIAELGKLDFTWRILISYQIATFENWLYDKNFPRWDLI